LGNLDARAKARGGVGHVEKRDRDFAAAFLEAGNVAVSRRGAAAYFAIEQAVFGLAGLTSARRSFGKTTRSMTGSISGRRGLISINIAVTSPMIWEVWVERLCGQAAIIHLPQVWGVQFHPEFSPEVLTDLAGEHPDVLRESGRDPDHVAVETSQWREETGVISRFARLQIKAVS
jgi:hypothetical protein